MTNITIEIVEKDNNIPPEKSILTEKESIEDFDTFKQNIRAQLDRLESRIAKIEIIRSEED